MPDRHGPYVPELPEVQPDPDYRQCQRFDRCGRRDGHAGSCLPCPNAIAGLRRWRYERYASRLTHADGRPLMLTRRQLDLIERTMP